MTMLQIFWIFLWTFLLLDLLYWIFGWPTMTQQIIKRKSESASFGFWLWCSIAVGAVFLIVHFELV